MAVLRPSTDERLRGLLEIARLAGGEADLPTVLGAIARGISEALEFATVAVNLLRPAEDDLEVVAVHGRPEAIDALLGTFVPRASWDIFLSPRFERNGAFAVRHGELDWSEIDQNVFTPDFVPGEGPDAWHPEDALFVRMDDAAGELLGVISVDEPLSGTWPSDVELAVLVAAAQHAAQAAQASQRAAEDARLRHALEKLVAVSARMQDAGSSDDVLAAVCEGIQDALCFGKVSAQVLDPTRGRFVVRATAGWEQSDPRVHTKLSSDDLHRLVAPQHLREGCALLTRAAAHALVHSGASDYQSERNGAGPRAWSGHWLVVPLYDRSQQLLGFLWADDPADRLLPSDERLQTLRMFADQAARALESAAHIGALARRGEELGGLHETTLALLERLDTDAILEAIVERARDLVGADDGYLYLPVPHEPDTMAVAVGGGSFASYRGTRIARGEGISGRVWQERRPLVVDDYSSWPGRLARYDGGGFTAIAAVPLMRGDRVDGVLGVANRNGDGGFTGPEVELLERFGRLVSLALEKGRMYDALHESRELYRRVVENSTELITLVDTAGRIVYASPSHRDVLGFDPGHLVGTEATRLLHEQDLARVRAGRARRGPGERMAFTLRVRHADGRWICTEGISSPILDPSGAVEVTLVTARDVTESRRAEQERIALEGELRQAQKMEAVGRLAGGIAHDFNNLLTAIVGYAELASTLDDPGEPLTQVKAAAERAASLTRQLLAFSRKQVLDLKVLDLNGVVRETGDLLARLLGEPVRLELELADNLGATRADRSQIDQVLMNLVINARDAMPSGGQLRIATCNAEPGSPLLDRPGVEPGSYVAVCVSDTGVGMDEETQARAFEPFFTTKAVGEGTGLGLSTVHGIVHQLSGHIWAESAPGEGAAFWFLLPRVDADVEAETPLVRHGNGGSEQILLVEDEEVVRRLTRQMLERSGYRVVAAASGEEAVEHVVAGAEVDAVVTDVVMHGMSGPDLVVALRSRRPSLPVLFTSGYAADEIGTRGDLPAGTAFLAKPFTRADLCGQLRALLDEPTAA